VPDQEKIDDQTTDASIPVTEGMDALEGRMSLGEVFEEVLPILGSSASGCDPAPDVGGNVRPRWRA
jgi:hypothetical protein